MSKVIDTVTDYEDKALQVLAKVQDEVLTYVTQAVELIDGRVARVELPFELPKVELLEQLPTLSEVVDTQFAFSKKLLANQEDFARNVVQAVRPLTGEAAQPAKAAKKTTKKVAA